MNILHRALEEVCKIVTQPCQRGPARFTLCDDPGGICVVEEATQGLELGMLSGFAGLLLGSLGVFPGIGLRRILHGEVAGLCHGEGISRTNTHPLLLSTRTAIHKVVTHMATGLHPQAEAGYLRIRDFVWSSLGRQPRNHPRGNLRLQRPCLS